MEKDIKETEKKEKDQNNKEKDKESEKFTIAEIRQYYAETLAKIKEIDTMLEKLESEASTKTEKEKKVTLEEISSKIKLYREDFYNVMEFLPGHDKLQYSKNYEDELEKVNNLRNKLFPKKKFAFSKANKKQLEANKEKIQKEKEKEKEKEQKVEELVEKELKETLETDLVIKDLKDCNKKYSKEEIKGKNNILMENINKCDIYLLFDFKACYINNCSNCNIYLGSISGGTHITNCTESKIYLMTHQLRIHQTTKTHFYVLINSNPIIEHSKENVFHPLKIKYDEFENNLKISGINVNNNNWDKVQDFQWLKKDKSPNFETDDSNEMVEI
jgi:hypothetical protein